MNPNHEREILNWAIEQIVPDGNPIVAIEKLRNRLDSIVVPNICPQCAASTIHANPGDGSVDTYCEECGWPDENRGAEELAKALNYYKAAFEKQRPDYVPSIVRLPQRVMGVMGCFADAGEYECNSNQYGAISVEAANGKTLGIKPKEFEVIEWTLNPHKS